jgi:hypothetical protein
MMVMRRVAFTGVLALWVLGAAAAARGGTRVGLVEGKWQINGAVTHAGAAAEGLLMNVRMVNSCFEDLGVHKEFDAEANTVRFVAKIPEYHGLGVDAFTVFLQGGTPGYEGAVNSAFEADGSLREEYLRRVAKIIDACDRQGMVVILGCFYQRQSKVLTDEAAVRAGVVNAAKWVREKGWKNVMMDVANEYPHPGFVHKVQRSPAGVAELIRLAKQTHPEMLVSSSGIGDGKLDDAVAEASDFLLIHFNGVPVGEIPARLAALKKFGKAIVCNEDAKSGEKAVRAMEACIANGASYGLMLEELNQHYPFTFKGEADDPVFYGRLREVTSGKGRRPPPDQVKGE